METIRESVEMARRIILESLPLLDFQGMKYKSPISP